MFLYEAQEPAPRFFSSTLISLAVAELEFIWKQK